ncbi:phosphopantetheine-binding protein [Sorangium sp. So ce854]|uniref:phosphopantetheine-binding protein n=1 Tax=Sorangium sp. So ce854 TaxID=3133322 RepID=UPI003F5F21CA
MSTNPPVHDAAPADPAGVRRVLHDVLLANKAAHAPAPEALRDDVLLGMGGLGLSSLLLLQVLVKLEESFGFTFEDAAVANATFLTVGDLARFVGEAVLKRQTTGSGSEPACRPASS